MRVGWQAGPNSRSEFEMNGLYSTASEVSGSRGAGLWLPVSLVTRAGAVVPMRLRTAGRG